MVIIGYREEDFPNAYPIFTEEEVTEDQVRKALNLPSEDDDTDRLVLIEGPYSIQDFISLVPTCKMPGGPPC